MGKPVTSFLVKASKFIATTTYCSNKDSAGIEEFCAFVFMSNTVPSFAEGWSLALVFASLDVVVVGAVAVLNPTPS